MLTFQSMKKIDCSKLLGSTMLLLDILLMILGALVPLYVNTSTTKKDTSMTLWSHGYDTSMTIIVTKTRIIIDVVGSYFYEKKS